MYRGRWLSGQHSAAPKDRADETSPVRGPTGPGIDILSWNCGGLTSTRFAELKQWLHTTPDGQRPQIVIIQETLWKTSSEWTDSKYSYVHSGTNRNKDGGLLLMVARELCSPDKLRYDELKPGRLLHIKLAMDPSFELIAIYQHSWRNDLSTTAKDKLLTQRAAIWRRLQQFVQSTPARAQVVIAGDFNCPIRTCLPYVGSGVRRNVKPRSQPLPDPAPDLDDLINVLRNGDLQVLNSFGKEGMAASTYINASHTPMQGSQIDFVVMRREQADDRSMRVQIMRDFPLLPIEGMWHFPLRVTVPRPIAPRSKPQDSRLTPDKASACLAREPEKAQHFQQMVNEMLQQAPTVDCINTVLLQAWDQTFGTVGDPREGFVSDARLATMWKHRALAMQAHSLLSRWHHLARYRSIRRVIQRRVQADKRAKIQQQLVDAEQASSTGQPGALYQVLRRIAPKIRRRKLQLRDAQGRLVGPREEATLILDHYSEVFASELAVADTQLECPFYFDSDELYHALSELPQHKALPQHCAPAPLWKLCAQTISQFTVQQFQGQLSSGSFRDQWPRDWALSFLCLLPKTDQRLDAIAKLRPISLLHPLGKSFAGLLMYRVRESITRKLASIPQFAYLVGRSTADAVDRAVWCTAPGIRQQTIQGSLTLSIDLRRAFDSIDRDLIRDALKWAEVPTEVLDVACMGDVWEAVANTLKEGPSKVHETTPQATQQLHHLGQAPTGTSSAGTHATPGDVPSQSSDSLQCQICDFRADNTPALRYHMTTSHGHSERRLAMEEKAAFRFEDHALAGMPTCRHCERAFTGVPQFRNHIMAQVCPVLHGALPSGRDYGEQPPLPQGASLENQPLRDRASTYQALQEGGWKHLATLQAFRQVALEHCPLCHLWVANRSGQVKKHMRHKHKDQETLIQQVIEVCRRSSFVLRSPCQLCHAEWKGPAIRHRESCTVFFAARLLAAIHGFQFNDEGGADPSDAVRVNLPSANPIAPANEARGASA
ncbi:unnamed protein product, partial [Symbiodinium sp. CCMP2592]